MNDSALSSVPICLGCDSKPFKMGENVDDILDAALSLGATTLDTARGYRHSEEVIGKWMKDRGSRDKIFLISKGCLPYPFPRVNPSALRHDLEASLKTLQTSYIDLYLLHRDQRKADMGRIFEILEGYRKEGKIRYYGVSNWTIDRIEEVNRLCEAKGFPTIKDVSNNVSLLPWDKDPFGGGDGCVSFAGDAESLSRAKKLDLTIYAYSPLSRGMLTGRINPKEPGFSEKLDHYAKKAYLSDDNLHRLKCLLDLSSRLGIPLPKLAISYLTHLETRVVPVIGVSKPERVKENLEAASLILDEKVMKEIDLIVNR